MEPNQGIFNWDFSSLRAKDMPFFVKGSVFMKTIACQLKGLSPPYERGSGGYNGTVMAYGQTGTALYGKQSKTFFSLCNDNIAIAEDPKWDVSIPAATVVRSFGSERIDKSNEEGHVLKKKSPSIFSLTALVLAIIERAMDDRHNGSEKPAIDDIVPTTQMLEVITGEPLPRVNEDREKEFDWHKGRRFMLNISSDFVAGPPGIWASTELELGANIISCTSDNLVTVGSKWAYKSYKEKESRAGMSMALSITSMKMSGSVRLLWQPRTRTGYPCHLPCQNMFQTVMMAATREIS
ncbi:hypothetical protein HPP92_028712 [Vanilla planifolia]|uniref:Uncharacterized protein n=1 Tax=Vanilla planifolia TaxID=51239 RepID=A0A835P561_VANPL|nr:hypothetical protein HPP92_028712 [Vanilla planifolia]KAG0446719.1 hypothetical protein HPP92_028695 [Vanilla planifolia]